MYLQNSQFTKGLVTPKNIILLAFVAVKITVALGMGMPQHICVVTLTLVECAWNGHKRPTRSNQRESIISLIFISLSGIIIYLCCVLVFVDNNNNNKNSKKIISK